MFGCGDFVPQFILRDALLCAAYERDVIGPVRGHMRGHYPTATGVMLALLSDVDVPLKQGKFEPLISA